MDETDQEEAVPAEVTRRIAEGEAFADEEADEHALACFQAAWNALPEAKKESWTACRIQVAIADSYFHLGQWTLSHQALQHALLCDGGFGNPFICLRLGQSLFELGDFREASNWLMQAYLEEGTTVFESEDPKYLNWLKSQVEPPPGGWPEGW